MSEKGFFLGLLIVACGVIIVLIICLVRRKCRRVSFDNAKNRIYHVARSSTPDNNETPIIKSSKTPKMAETVPDEENPADSSANPASNADVIANLLGDSTPRLFSRANSLASLASLAKLQDLEKNFDSLVKTNNLLQDEVQELRYQLGASSLRSKQDSKETTKHEAFELGATKKHANTEARASKDEKGEWYAFLSKNVQVRLLFCKLSIVVVMSNVQCSVFYEIFCQYVNANVFLVC